MKLPLAAARAPLAVGSDLLLARVDFLMFREKDKRKDHSSLEVQDGVDDDIGAVPYMVTVTTTKPITPLFLPDPVVHFTIRLLSGSNLWKRYVCSVTLDPGKLSLKTFVRNLPSSLASSRTHMDLPPRVSFTVHLLRRVQD
jgi:hypothetical protein